jgi:hypothetical protein
MNPGENVSFVYCYHIFHSHFAVSATSNHPIVSLPIHSQHT